MASKLYFIAQPSLALIISLICFIATFNNCDFDGFQSNIELLSVPINQHPKPFNKTSNLVFSEYVFWYILHSLLF